MRVHVLRGGGDGVIDDAVNGKSTKLPNMQEQGKVGLAKPERRRKSVARSSPRILLRHEGIVYCVLLVLGVGGDKMVGPSAVTSLQHGGNFFVRNLFSIPLQLVLRDGSDGGVIVAQS